MCLPPRADELCRRLRCCRLQSRLVDHIVARGRAVELRQPLLDHGRILDPGEHPDRRLAGTEVAGDPRLVLIAELQPLVVEPAGGRAAEDADAKGRGAEHEQARADPRTRAPAAGADLVHLEVAGGVEDQDPDRVAGRDPGVLERRGRRVRRRFIGKEGEHELLLCHVRSFLCERATPARHEGQSVAPWLGASPTSDDFESARRCPCQREQGTRTQTTTSSLPTSSPAPRCTINSTVATSWSCRPDRWWCPAGPTAETTLK